MINQERLRMILQVMVERLILHERSCNLNPDREGSYGMGCTCGAREVQQDLTLHLEKLEEPLTEEEQNRFNWRNETRFK